MGTITMASEEYDAMVAERDRLKAENERLRKSYAGVIARSVHETRSATNSALDGYLAAGIAATDAELDTLRQQLAELREVNRIQLEIATVHGAACVGIRKQRDKLMVENERLKESLKVIMGEDLKSAGLRQQEGEIKTLRKALDEARELLTRYRKETPIGYQPHMIAHIADAWLEANHK